MKWLLVALLKALALSFRSADFMLLQTAVATVCRQCNLLASTIAGQCGHSCMHWASPWALGLMTLLGILKWLGFGGA